MFGQIGVVNYRLVSSIMLLFIFISTANSQQIEDTRISLDIREQSLKEVLEIIAAQSGVPFSYNPRKVPIDQKITYSAQEKTLDEIMKDFPIPFENSV